MAGLDAGIELMWTGTDVFSRELEAADMVDVTARTGRKPVIWDNEYATDGGDAFVGKIYLAPFLGRSEDLPGAITGIVQNMSIPGATNRLTLGAVGAYLRDPTGYDPEAAQEDAMRLEAIDPWDRALAWEMARTFYGNGTIGIPAVAFPKNGAMESAIGAMRLAVHEGTRDELTAAAWDLLREAARMATTQTRLHHGGLDPSLVDDLWVPADRLSFEGLSLLTMLDWLGARMAGDSGEDLRERIIALNFAALGVRMQLSLFWVEGFWDFLLTAPSAITGFDAPDIADSTAMPRPGEPWRYRANERGSVAWEVFGLDGAYIEDGTLVWTPPHAGTWNAVAIAASADGWAWKSLTIVVNEPRNDEWSPPADDDADDDDETPDESDAKDDEDDACGC
ncbi:MAG: beta-N-acetylglucosaminidase domain-containing protein [Deltaproteobacteria bacterium]|nr:beta-N-acetylglucosaminidase domain-containing protein [Deltaproteobacteria bacterium]